MSQNLQSSLSPEEMSATARAPSIASPEGQREDRGRKDPMSSRVNGKVTIRSHDGCEKVQWIVSSGLVRARCGLFVDLDFIRVCGSIDRKEILVMGPTLGGDRVVLLASMEPFVRLPESTGGE
ncbi:hypothetical protein Tco_0865585 [Tanacetum coccineum]